MHRLNEEAMQPNPTMKKIFLSLALLLASSVSIYAQIPIAQITADLTPAKDPQSVLSKGKWTVISIVAEPSNAVPTNNDQKVQRDYAKQMLTAATVKQVLMQNYLPSTWEFKNGKCTVSSQSVGNQEGKCDIKGNTVTFVFKDDSWKGQLHSKDNTMAFVFTVEGTNIAIVYQTGN
jgi:hypothetical protein